MAASFGYGIAIDAGSSGSRIYLYRWPQHSLRSTSFAKVEREAIFSEERTPGINAPQNLGIHLLEELLTLVKDALPSDVDSSEVPIYLGATAGMRIVDPSYEADIMTKCRLLLHSSGFVFQDEWARTLSGEEEGVYDWLVANYLKNGGDLPSEPWRTYGALDLGGASTQISYPLAQAESLSTMDVGDSDGFPLWIDNVEYPLHTQSFLYYGVDQARIHYDQTFAVGTKSNPCYPTGYIDSESDVAGESNWEACLDSVATFFDQTPHCHGEGRERCLIDDGSGRQPLNSLYSEHQKFIAMSAFVYIWDYLGLPIGAHTGDLNELNAQAQRVCNLTYRQQIARYENHMEHKPTKRITSKPHAQCFNAAFSYHLLSRGYGMPISNTPIEIHYDIGGTKVQWALGLMLVEANKLQLGSSIRNALSANQRQRRLFEEGYPFDMGIPSTCLPLLCAAVLIMLSWVLGKLRKATFSLNKEPSSPLATPNATLHDPLLRKCRRTLS